MTTFKMVGRTTLMCGDGTNDVGALKQDYISLFPQPHHNMGAETTSKKKKKMDTSTTDDETVCCMYPRVYRLCKARSVNGEGPSKSRIVARTGPTNHSAGSRHLAAAEMQQQKLRKLMDELNKEGDGRSAPVVKLGDASMTSPFTAKHASVSPTTDIIHQGRSTLVTTLQMFKILGLTCLATAYVLSVMNLDGVKLGDFQATISGIFIAAFFLFISQARPLPTLSAEWPQPHVFCSYISLSLIGQFAIHLIFLISSVKEAEKYMPDECIEPDSDFHTTWDLNDWLKLVSLPVALRNKLLLWALLMFLCCYVWEGLLRLAFPGRIPAWKKRHRAAANTEKKRL
ncbi:phosphate deficiency response 2 [Actinidia rufa]|uniref:Phosphate deficiency response 2 n=1 Tax=Actinidia rufa TaxID=165716 RepID=A0A7J0EIZ6_9ERIC|nr:phosphate deficiency response 2 [Actinidia rufa]